MFRNINNNNTSNNNNNNAPKKAQHTQIANCSILKDQQAEKNQMLEVSASASSSSDSGSVRGNPSFEQNNEIEEALPPECRQTSIQLETVESRLAANERELAASKRREIDIIRRKLEYLDCKTPDNQEIILTLDDDTGLAIIELKSGAKNALSGRMISQLTEALDRLYEWPEGRSLIICGHAHSFCSGSDLIAVQQTIEYGSGLELAQMMQYNLMRIQQLPMITLAFIEGYALGGGAELATASDLRIMTESAKIGFIHIKVGVCCGWGGGSRLVQLVGPSKATELLASGRLVSANEAIELGLANAVVQTREQAKEYLARHLIGSRPMVCALKSMINSARLLPLQEALEREAKLFASTWGESEHKKALSANIKHK